jgi:hypothetical protein
MNIKEIILKLKQDLKSVYFDNNMFIYTILLKGSVQDKAVFDSYMKGIKMITTEIDDSCWYLKDKKAMADILYSILGVNQPLTEDAYRRVCIHNKQRREIYSATVIKLKEYLAVQKFNELLLEPFALKPKVYFRYMDIVNFIINTVKDSGLLLKDEKYFYKLLVEILGPYDALTKDVFHKLILIRYSIVNNCEDMLPLSDPEKYCEDFLARTRNEEEDDDNFLRLITKIKEQLEINIAEAAQKKKQEELKKNAMEEQKTKDKDNLIKLKEDLDKLDFKGILLEMSTVEFGIEKSLNRYMDFVTMIEGVLQDWYNISDKDFYTILVDLVGSYNDITAEIYITLITSRYRSLKGDIRPRNAGKHEYETYVKDFLARMKDNYGNGENTDK